MGAETPPFRTSNMCSCNRCRAGVTQRTPGMGSARSATTYRRVPRAPGPGCASTSFRPVRPCSGVSRQTVLGRGRAGLPRRREKVNSLSLSRRRHSGALGARGRSGSSASRGTRGAGARSMRSDMLSPVRVWQHPCPITRFSYVHLACEGLAVQTPLARCYGTPPPMRTRTLVTPGGGGGDGVSGNFASNTPHRNQGFPNPHEQPRSMVAQGPTL